MYSADGEDCREIVIKIVKRELREDQKLSM